MGLDDEHWCTVCKKHLDKRTDKYMEFEMLNPGDDKVGKRNRGMICEKCYTDDPALGEAVKKIRKAGNPMFTPVVECLVYNQCETYSPVVGRAVRCEHMAVSLDRLYCKRAHPGELELAMETTEYERLKDRVMSERVLEALSPERAMALGISDEIRQGMSMFFGPQLEAAVEQAHKPPSEVVLPVPCLVGDDDWPEITTEE